MLKNVIRRLTENKYSLLKTVLICAAAAALVITAIYVSVSFVHSRLPVCVIGVDELNVSTPGEAQTILREQAEQFREIRSEHADCVYVWCGSPKLYLVRSGTLDFVKTDGDEAFQKVRIYNANGLKVSGYILDPCVDSKELGRIKLKGGDDYTFDSVSMTVRVGLKNGEISYKNAKYLWEEGKHFVIAVDKRSVEGKAGKLITYTDDGNTQHRYYILDTKIDKKTK